MQHCVPHCGQATGVPYAGAICGWLESRHIVAPLLDRCVASCKLCGPLSAAADHHANANANTQDEAGASLRITIYVHTIHIDSTCGCLPPDTQAVGAPATPAPEPPATQICTEREGKQPAQAMSCRSCSSLHLHRRMHAVGDELGHQRVHTCTARQHRPSSTMRGASDPS